MMTIINDESDRVHHNNNKHTRTNDKHTATQKQLQNPQPQHFQLEDKDKDREKRAKQNQINNLRTQIPFLVSQPTAVSAFLKRTTLFFISKIKEK
jgi:hypothetical protein